MISRQPAKYSIFSGSAVYDQRLSAGDVRVLAELGTHSNGGGWCRPFQKTMADELCLNRTTVSLAITKLTDLGYIEKRARLDKSHRKLGNEYRVLVDLPENHPMLANSSVRESCEPAISEVALQMLANYNVVSDVGLAQSTELDDSNILTKAGRAQWKSPDSSSEESTEEGGEDFPDPFGLIADREAAKLAAAQTLLGQAEPELPKPEPLKTKPAKKLAVKKAPAKKRAPKKRKAEPNFPEAFDKFWFNTPPKARDRCSKEKTHALWQDACETYGEDRVYRAVDAFMRRNNAKREGGQYCPATYRLVNGELAGYIEQLGDEKTPDDDKRWNSSLGAFV